MCHIATVLNNGLYGSDLGKGNVETNQCGLSTAQLRL